MEQARPPKLEMRDVVKRFDDAAGPAVNRLTVCVGEGEMLVLLGPSGCGKTTTLQMVAGLMHPDGGEIAIDGRTVAGAGWGWPPERRNLGMVFQSYAVWPHRTVYDNVAYGLKIRRLSTQEIERRVRRSLEMVQLGELAARYPSEISGGQQQRVALARAIVVNPSLLLLDEPLSNLDATLREQMRIELKNLQRQLGLAALYVTHDQAEAMVLADHLVIMRNGVIEQHGAAHQVFSRPHSRFVAGFLGTANLIAGRIVEMDAGLARVDIAGLGTAHGYVDDVVRAKLTKGGEAFLAVRSIAIVLTQTRPDAVANCFAGNVSQRTFLGDVTEYVITTAGPSWRVQTLSSQPLYTVDQRVWLAFDAAAANVVRDT